MTRTSKSETHRRRGYIVTHHTQRTSHGHTHHFTVHDLGALCIPKARHLVRMFIAKRSPDGKKRTIISTKSGTSGVRSVWYEFEIQYQR